MNIRSTMIFAFSTPINSSLAPMDYSTPQVRTVIKHQNHYILITYISQDARGRMDNSLSLVAGLLLSHPLSLIVPLKKILISQPMMCGYKRFHHSLIIDRRGTPVYVLFQNIVLQSSGIVL